MGAHADHPVDPDALRAFSFRTISALSGALTAAMIHLGDRLGLYRALGDADRPLSASDLASRCGLHERWVREWSYNQAAAGLVQIDSDELVSLTPEAAAVLADADHPAFAAGWFHSLPSMMGLLDGLAESFRTGVGFDYDAQGPAGAVGMERSFEPWNRAHLVPTVLPELEGVVAKLTEGATVIDVGCGAGGAVLLLARAFPHATVRGYDISSIALARAEERRLTTGAGNASFHHLGDSPLPTDGSIDLVTTFDCVHDMTHPAAVASSIRQALRPDGTWLLVDIKAKDTYAENVATNPMAALMYGMSVMTCLSSSLSEPDGAGLGTLGLPPRAARALALDAGFSRFRAIDVDHAVNAFYEVRP